jgi:quinol monooxygenase YgiN
MDQLVVVVHMMFRKGDTEAAIDAFRPAIARSQEEPGCLKYAIHRDVDDPDVLVIVEQWESRDAQEEHLRQPHIQELNQTVAPLMAGVPRISISRALEIGDAAKATI